MKKYSKILSLALLGLGLSSCLKDDMIDDQKYGMIDLNAKKVIEIPSNGSHVNTLAIIPEDATIVKTIFTVNLAAEQVAQEDVVVNLGLTNSAQIVADYNQANDDAVAQLTTGFTIPSSVTIPKGSRSANVQISWNPKALADAVGIGVNIQGVDKAGYTVSGNYGSVMVLFSPKSPVDGLYNYKTSSTTSLVPNNNEDDVPLVTVNGRRVSNNLLNAYSNIITYDIDPVTNKATVVSVVASIGTVATDPSSHWDPVKKVLYVKWTAGARSFEETYTRTGESD